MTLNSANPYTQFDWDFPLKKDNVLSITSNVYNFYNKLISAALNKDDFSTLSKYMTDDADKSDKIKEVYSELTADIGGDNNYYSYLYQQFKSNLDYEESPKTVSNNITYVNKDTYGVSTSFSDKDSYAGSFFGAKELAVLFKEQNGEQLVSDIYYTSV
jgi:hypothetical protein